MGQKLNKLMFFKNKKSCPEMVTHSSFDESWQPHRHFLHDLPSGPYPVFGISLQDAAKLDDQFDDTSIFTPSYNKWENSICLPAYQKYVPKVLLKCIKFIHDYGLKEEGLYRVSGSGLQVKALRDAFINLGPSFDIPPTTDVHAVTSLVKSFVRELPDQILPVTKCHTFLSYTPSTSFTFENPASFSPFTPEEQDLDPCVIPTQILQEILQQLSTYNFAAVHTLTRHFATVVAHSASNRMSVSSLSLILCPTLRIHKSVFAALLLKSQTLWLDLHPANAEISAKGLRYDTRNIITYRAQDDLTESTMSSCFSTDPSSSSMISEVTSTSMVDQSALDPISFDLYDRRTSSLLPPTPELDHEDDLLFNSPFQHTPSESISSNRLSDIFNIPKNELKHAPSFSEYRYKQPTAPTRDKITTSRSTGSNRTLFLRKSVANF